MAVKTEIMTQKATDSSYDATDEVKGNPQKLLEIVAKDLTGAEWTPRPAYNSSNKVIEITYTNSSLREGMYGEGKPAQSGKIEFEIELEGQDVALSVDGEAVNGGLSRKMQAKIDALNSNTELQEVAYTPTINSEVSVVIPSENNGGVAEQTFTQENLGIQDLTWYVLSADEDGVKLVSSPTTRQIRFRNADGYDNCLYYLNEIATKLCTNESLGITASRVHALRLSDIKVAAEKMNGSSYNWDYDMIRPSSSNTYNSGNVGKKNFTLSSSRYPQIYGTSTGAVNLSNPMYDEEIPSGYTPISEDRITLTSATATTLIGNQTTLSTANKENTISRLGSFGTSGIGVQLLSRSCWLATRSVFSQYQYAIFGLQGFFVGKLGSGYLCDTMGSSGEGPSGECRFVVTVPGKHINISNDGTVTLK